MDDRWLTAENWSGDVLPDPGDRVFFDVPGVILVEEGDSVNPRKIIGPCENCTGTVELTFTGGTLVNDSYWYIARQPGGEGILNLNGAAANVRTRDLYVAQQGGAATVNIIAGRLQIYGSAAGTGLFICDDDVSSATVNLFGGLMEITQISDIGTGGVINITYGQLIMPKDQRTLINSYVSNQRIIAFDGNSQVQLDYDIINPGMTTAYAIGSIEQAVSSATEGSTVYIPPAVYNESQLNIDKPLTLKAVEGPESTVINVAGNGISIISDNVKIDGFTIQNQDTSTVYLVRVANSTENVYYPVNSCSLINCVLKSDNNADGLTIYRDSNDISLLSSVVRNCVNGVVVYDNASNISIIDNDIYYNSYGVRVLGSEPVKILANGIYWNEIYGLLNSGTTVVNAANNFWGMDTGPYNPVSNPSGQGNTVSQEVIFEPYFEGCSDDRWHICPQDDLNGDCRVDFADIAILAGQWLVCNGPDCE